MYKWITSLVLSVMILSFSVTGYAQEVEKPPLSIWRITKEVLVGVGGGIVGSVCVAAFLYFVTDEDSVIIGGLATGLAYGSAASVYYIGDTDNETGSFSATMLGTLAGGTVGAVCAFAIASVTNDERDDISDAILLIPVASAIGATVEFNLTRRYKSPPNGSETALINCRDGQISLAVPRVYIQTDPFGRGNLSQRVDLLKVRF